MSGQEPLSERMFTTILNDKLGGHFDRCLAIFLKYQEQYSRRLANVFCKTYEHNLLADALTAFEQCTSPDEVLKYLLIFEGEIERRRPSRSDSNPFGITKL